MPWCTRRGSGISARRPSNTVPPVHPAVVHFPIALVTLSVVADAVGVLFNTSSLMPVGWWGARGRQYGRGGRSPRRRVRHEPRADRRRGASARSYSHESRFRPLGCAGRAHVLALAHLHDYRRNPRVELFAGRARRPRTHPRSGLAGWRADVRARGRGRSHWPGDRTCRARPTAVGLAWRGGTPAAPRTARRRHGSAFQPLSELVPPCRPRCRCRPEWTRRPRPSPRTTRRSGGIPPRMPPWRGRTNRSARRRRRIAGRSRR